MPHHDAAGAPAAEGAAIIAGAFQSYSHWTQVVFEIGVERRAACQSPPSIETSTLPMPRSGAQATPATGTWPVLTLDPLTGRSIRDWVRIGAFFAQPSGTQ